LEFRENGTEEIENFRNTKKMILSLLLNGSRTAGEISENLKIQKSAIRTHLESLRAENTIKSYFKAEGLGRPKKMYEITDKGRELFPRMYDSILSLVLQAIKSLDGHEHAKEIVTYVADGISHDIKEKIGNGSTSLEKAITILNYASNEMGFMSSMHKEDDNTYSIISRNCVVHKSATTHQDILCHGLHSRIIEKTLQGKNNSPKVQLENCIALGDRYSKHIITLRKKAKEERDPKLT